MDEKKRGGKPEHVPTTESRAKVADFTCAGFTQDDIAQYFGIDDKTLRKHYRDELDKAKLEMIRGLSQNAYRKDVTLTTSVKKRQRLIRYLKHLLKS
jgi:DNA-binding NarL/FixJ family response regulator